MDFFLLSVIIFHFEYEVMQGKAGCGPMDEVKSAHIIICYNFDVSLYLLFALSASATFLKQEFLMSKIEKLYRVKP